MKRVAFVGDSHFDERSRFDECVSVHDFIARDLGERRVDLLVHTGDVFERRSTATERNAVASWLAACAEHCPVLVVRGNHDQLGDLAIFRRLKSEGGHGHEIVVEEGAGVHVLAGVAIAAVAWPRKAQLLASLQANVGHAESEQVAGEVLGDLFRGLALQLAQHAGPRLATAHAMVRGSLTSIGQPLVGCDLEVGLEQLDQLGAEFVALGHVHKGQDWHGRAPIVYTGSPRRTAFGEVEAKGYVVASFHDQGGLLDWERVPTPAREMLWLQSEFRDGAFVPRIELDGMANAEVRFRYRVAVEHRESARLDAQHAKQAMLTHGLAHAVKIEEEVLATARPRAPEVAKAQSLQDKLLAMWAANSAVPVDGGERLFAKLHAVGG